MKRTIFFFVKVFKEKAHAEALLNGHIYISRLSYFRKIEDEGEIEANRSDEHEGICDWLQPGQVITKINEYEINSEDLAAPISARLNYHDNLNVFCLYAAHSGEFESLSEETLLEFNKQLEIPVKCLNLGKYAVVVTNKSEFIQRIKSSVQKNGYGIEAKLVDYYDPTEFSGHFGEQAVFKKRIEFQHQREYRIAIDTGIYGDDALRLEIGDIRDIAHSCDVTDVNKGLEIKLAK